jgi:SAM-dependent methyltransferase
MGRVMNRLRRIRHSIASSGLRRTLSDLALHVLPLKALSYTAAVDSFDDRFGTDTGGIVQPAELGIDDAVVREKAILYLGSPPRVTRWMLANCGIDATTCSFVDLGCGKGRVLLLASELPFKQVVGVEISSELCTVARRNAELYRPPSRRADIEIHNCDATKFDFPETNLLVHMYHPFDPELTVKVFEHLGQSLAVKPRRVVVAYLLYTEAVPGVEAAFARIPWLKRSRFEHSVTGQYDWLFYSNDFEPR